MELTAMPIPGVTRLDLVPHVDERGWFARATCADVLDQAGLVPTIAQTSLSFNARRGTLRGLHWQAPPHTEAKVVRVLAGAIVDVVVDLRPDSPTWRQYLAVDLTGPEVALYLPPGVAHGFQTLTDHTLVHYQMSASYVPDAARGLRWDDPRLQIPWPVRPPILSPRDQAWPFLDDLDLDDLVHLHEVSRAA